jgi:hypothetical protein
MRHVIPALLLVAATVQGAFAHIVPIPPSTCRFEPLDFSVPAIGLNGAAETGGVNDMMRIVFDAAESQIQLCPTVSDTDIHCGAPVPRPFTLGTMTGTVMLPSLFEAAMLSSGDLTIPDMPLTLTVGGSTVTIPVTMTTGLVAVEGTVVQGTPLQGLGSFTLVGALSGDALPPPVTGQSILVTFSCQPRPVPDKDQFSIALPLTPIKGQITSKQAHLTATAAISSATPPQLSGVPLLLAVNVDGMPVASAVLPSGVQGSRRLTGTSDDGKATITVRQTATRLVLTALLRNVTLPPQGGGRVLVDLTLDSNGLIGRGEQLFRATGNGKRLAAVGG